MDFSTLVQDIHDISVSAQTVAARTVDHLATLRNWLIGAWIVEYEQHGADRAAYGDGLLDRLTSRLGRARVSGMSARNLKNFRQIALTWPELDPLRAVQVLLGALPVTAELQALPNRQTASADSALDLHPLSASGLTQRVALGFPSLTAKAKASDKLPWQDSAWTQKLFSALTFSHLLELSRIETSLKRGFYELQVFKEARTAGRSSGAETSDPVHAL